jgi:hypothetical protein
MKPVLALAVVSLAATSFGGADPQLLAQVAARQAALDDYAVDMRIAVYEGGGERPELEFAARSVRRGPAMLQEFRNYVVLLHPEMRLVVDRSAQTIHLNAAQAEASTTEALDPAAILERAGRSGYEIDAQRDARAVTLRFTADAHPDYVMEFEPEDLRLVRMEMGAPDGSGSGRTVVSYDWRPSAVVSAEQLAPGHYVRRAGSGWQPAPAFAGYRVVVTREP